jgi:hypothetical protein
VPTAAQRRAFGAQPDEVADAKNGVAFGAQRERARLFQRGGVARGARGQRHLFQRDGGQGRHHRDEQQHGEQRGAAFGGGEEKGVFTARGRREAARPPALRQGADADQEDLPHRA